MKVEPVSIGPIQITVDASVVRVAEYGVGYGGARLSGMPPFFARILGHALIAMADAADQQAEAQALALADEAASCRQAEGR